MTSTYLNLIQTIIITLWASYTMALRVTTPRRG
jgi:hypothetical protein